MVICKKDIQVDWEVDGKTLENAIAKKTDLSFAYPENANHVLKYEDVPREQLNALAVAQRYNAPNAELDWETADTIFNWLNNQVQ